MRSQDSVGSGQEGAQGQRVGTAKYTDEGSLPQLTEEEFAAVRATARPYTLCVLKAGPGYENPGPGAESRVARIIWQHGKRNVALHEAGILHVVCPVVDGGEVKGVGIFSAAPEEVDRIMSEDPGVKADVFTYEIHPCRSFPGSTLP